MNTRPVLVAAVALLIPFGAMSAKNVPAGAAPAPARSTQISPTALTAEECKKLGGTTVTGSSTADACRSGSYCSTTDQDGKGHAVCLSVAK